jgi:hypothetical protein
MTPSPSPSPRADALDVRITCYDTQYYDETVYTDFRDAWDALPPDECDAELVSGKGTPAQREAAAQWWEEKSAKDLSERRVIRSLEIAVARCAEWGPLTYDWIGPDIQNPAGHITNYQWLYRLCPDHPDRDNIMTLLKAEKVGHDENPWFIDGGRVGKDFPAGTYVSRGNNGCYWELTDSRGNITNNNFSMSPRMQVTIPASAYAFSSENCNKWRKG